MSSRELEEGTLSLDDTLSQWLPDLTGDIPNSVGEASPKENRITIRQLLGHTSSIRDYITEPELLERFTIEKATGSILASQLRQRIFTPLGMNQYPFTSAFG